MKFPTLRIKDSLAAITVVGCLVGLLPAFSEEPKANSRLNLQTPEPKTALDHNNRGVELGSKGLWERAINEHEEALLTEPTNKYFRTNLSAACLRYGNLLFKEKKYEAAGQAFRKALYVDPENKPAKEGWATSLKSAKDGSVKATESVGKEKQTLESGPKGKAQ